MNPPFSVKEFLEIFERYNLGVWPMQIFLYLLGLLAVFLSIKKRSLADKAISSILAFLWLWIGVVYHLIYFTAINKAAYFFGMLNIIQGLIFLFAGVFRSNLSFRFHSTVFAHLGSLFILYGMLIYPILGHVLGHIYPQSPTFGLPCPTTIFTFGLLLWTDKRLPKYVLLIPLIWSIIGFTAALSLTIQEDFGLLIAGVLGTLVAIIRDRKLSLIKA